MKGKGSSLLVNQLEFLEKGTTFDLGPMRTKVLTVALILEEFIFTAVSKTRPGKKVTVDNILNAPEGK